MRVLVVEDNALLRHHLKVQIQDAGHQVDDAEGMKQFIDGLALPEEEKARLKAMTPANYIGRAITMVDELK